MKGPTLHISTIPLLNIQDTCPPQPLGRAKERPPNIMPLADLGRVVPNEAADLQINPFENRDWNTAMTESIVNNRHKRVVDKAEPSSKAESAGFPQRQLFEDLLFHRREMVLLEGMAREWNPQVKANVRAALNAKNIVNSVLQGDGDLPRENQSRFGVVHGLAR